MTLPNFSPRCRDLSRSQQDDDGPNYIDHIQGSSQEAFSDQGIMLPNYASVTKDMMYIINILYVNVHMIHIYYIYIYIISVICVHIYIYTHSIYALYIASVQINLDLKP